MNKISKLTIKNFRQFEKLEIEFKGDSTYYSIAGKNRVGKTTVLEAIDLAFNQNIARYTKIEESDFYDGNDIEIVVKLEDPFFLLFKDPLKRLIPCYKFKKVIKFRKNKEKLKTFSSEYDVSWEFYPEEFEKSKLPFEIEVFQTELREKGFLTNSQHIVRSFKYENSSTGGIEVTYGQASGEEYTIKILDFKYLQRVLFPEIFYFDSNREKEIIPGYNTLISKILVELEWRYRGKLEVKKNSIVEDSQKVFKQIRELDGREEVIFKGVNSLLEESFENTINSGDLGLYPFNWFSPYVNSTWGLLSENQRIIPVNRIGSGMSNLLSLILSISFARVAKNPVILLVDEPELHLESSLKKQIFEFLKEIPELAIVATHSPQFINRELPESNVIIRNDDGISVEYGSPLNLLYLIFELFGETLEDLLLFSKLVVVEGSYDRQLVLKCLDLLGFDNQGIEVEVAGGHDKVKGVSERYEYTLRKVLGGEEWFTTYLRGQTIKIIVDEDVSEDKVDGWVSTYKFDKEKQVLRVGNAEECENQDCFEYIYPKSLVKKFVEEEKTKLSDGSDLKDKSRVEIIAVILSDEKIEKKEDKQQIENRISKQRLNDYVTENISKEILESEEGEKLNEVIKWIIDEETEVFSGLEEILDLSN
ncbi:ATP-binding protein [bacterium]|nr:ATP-binding protein [bacterium]